MQRFTISLQDKLAQAFDDWIAARRYANRSEAFRDLLRAELERGGPDEAHAEHCVASLSYVFNRGELDVARRLAGLHHDHHDLLISTMNVPLDHDFRLETLALRGQAQAVRQFADLIGAQRGVRHAKLNLISVETHQSHRHPRHEGAATGKKAAGGSPHTHLRPAH